MEQPLRVRRGSWLPSGTAAELSNGPSQPVSLTELWMYSVEAIDTIVLWRGGLRKGGNGGPTMGLFHWKCQPSHQGTIQLGRGCFVKSQGTKLVETSMKLLCDDSGKTKGAHEPEHLHANHRKLNLKCGAAGCEKVNSADDTSSKTKELELVTVTWIQ